MSEELLDRHAAGARVGQTGHWMVTKARTGKIPCKRIGRSYWWTEAHIAEILEMAEQRPAEKKPPKPRPATRPAGGKYVRPPLKPKPPVRRAAA